MSDPVEPGGRTRDFATRNRFEAELTRTPGAFHFLGVGIDRYPRWPRLETAARGAAGVAAALRGRYGFEAPHCQVLLDADATRLAINAALRSLARKAGPEDQICVYFAGHGAIDDLSGLGYWIPVDGEPPAGEGAEGHGDTATWISNLEVKAILAGCRARHALLISDSCYSGDFVRTREQPPITDAYVRKAYGLSSRQVLTAGGLHPVVDGGFGGHSQFTHFLLKALREHAGPYLLPATLHQRVAGGLAENNAGQTPLLGTIQQTGGELGGEFVFFLADAPAGGGAPAPASARATPAPPPPPDRPARAWATYMAGLAAHAEALAPVEILELRRRLREWRGEELEELLENIELMERGSAASARSFARWWLEGGVPAQAAAVLPVAKAVPSGPGSATKERPYINSLGMKFVPVVVEGGGRVMFSVWEVRVKDYAAYAEAVGGVDGSWKSPGFGQEGSHPVVCVSWEDARRFCEWLTEKERREGRIGPGQRYRLPTDGEWSWGVGIGGKEGGGTPGEKSRKLKGVWPWGTQWPPPKGAGNYSQSLGVDGYEFTSPVGSFGANSQGLHDMGGNVWEWCEDDFDGNSGLRVLRGGSWNFNVQDYLLSSYRGSSDPGLRINYVGFRCVLDCG